MEIYKDYVDIEGYEGLYCIDKNGNVYSKITCKKKKQVFTGNGYLYVHLHKNGKSKLLRVHRLVAKTFIPNPQNKPQVNHIDGDKTNNCVNNLEWVSNNENIKHAVDNWLLTNSGQMNPSAKLTWKQVDEIRKTYVKGSKKFGTTALAKKYGVSNVVIGKIVRNESWNKERYDF